MYGFFSEQNPVHSVQGKLASQQKLRLLGEDVESQDRVRQPEIEMINSGKKEPQTCKFVNLHMFPHMLS